VKYLIFTSGLLMAAFTAAAGDIATERTQAATGAVITVISQINEKIKEVTEFISEIEGMANAVNPEALETFITDRFGSYEVYLAKLNADGRIDELDLRTKFRNWSQTHQDTIKNTLMAHGIHAQEVDDAELRLQRLQTLTRSADGRMKVLQIGQEIATEELKQLHSLKEIMMEQSNLHGSYFAMKQSMQAQKEAVDTWTNRDLGLPTVVGDEPAPFFR